MKSHKFFNLIIIFSLLWPTLLMNDPTLVQAAPKAKINLYGGSSLEPGPLARSYQGETDLSGSDIGSTPEADRLIDKTVKTQTLEAYGRLPFSFIPNRGQVDEQVAYYARTGNISVWFTDNGLKMELPGTSLNLEFLNPNPATRLVGGQQLPGIVNYFIGNDPARWRTNLPTYAGIAYEQLYPGIDVRYEGTKNGLKSAYLVAPGADPSRIRWRYDGATQVHIDEVTGDLIIELPSSLSQDSNPEIIERAPVAWQNINDRRVYVPTRYTITSDSSIGFALGNYDPTYPLVIDPEMLYSTFLGGNSSDQSYDVAVDKMGNAYVVGVTSSSDFPATTEAFSTTLSGSSDVFVAKVNTNGTDLVYATFLGGGSGDTGYDIAVDETGNAYVTGSTASSDFPVTTGAFTTTYGGIFVAKLNADGANLDYATFLGGSSSSSGRGIAVDSLGHVYVTGIAGSAIPTTPGAYATIPASLVASFAFMVKLNPVGNGPSDLLYGTYLSARYGNLGYGIALDEMGNAYVAGVTYSGLYPVTAGAWDTDYAGSGDGFVVKLNPAGNGANDLLYGTYIGGTGTDIVYAIAVDKAGSAYVTGVVDSYINITPGAFDQIPQGSTEAFVIRLNITGTDVIYSSYLGGNRYDEGYGIAVDEWDNAYVTGFTNATNFPRTPDALDASIGLPSNNREAFVSKVNPDGTQLLYSSFLGEGGDDYGYGIAIDGAGGVYVVGFTEDSNFPTTPGAFDTTYGGGSNDGFVTKFALNYLIAVTPPTRTITAGSQATYTVSITGTGDFTYPVTLDLAGLPADSSLAWATNPAVPTTTVPFTITTAYNTLPNSYPLTVTAVANSITHTAYALLTVTPYTGPSPLTNSTKTAYPTTVAPGDLLTYTITLVNSGPVPVLNARITDTLPLSVTYQTGSLDYDTGSGGYANGVITWTGDVPASPPITITYQITVANLADGTTLINQAVISDGVTPPFTLTAPITVTQLSPNVYLPVILKDYP